MDSLTNKRQIIKEVLNYYSQFKPSHGDIRLETIFDENQDRYALMQIGWDRGKRIRGNLIYLAIRDGKIWLEYDGIEQGIIQDLISQGIPENEIILGFLTDVSSVSLSA